MKKTWIKIKRGLLEPVHREAIGIRIWLYIYMIDTCDWDTGTIEGWTDKTAGEELDMPWRTVQRQRQELADAGYIDCEPAFQSQTIIISKWINPRQYSGEEITGGGTQKSVGGTQKRVPIPPENCVPFLIAHINTTYELELPEPLWLDEFCPAWFEWEEYRKEKKKKLTKISVKKQLALLARYAPYAVAMIDKSILNGWQGLFEPDARTMAAPRVNSDKNVKPGKSGGLNL